MAMPHDLGRLSRIRDFPTFKAAVERVLRQHDARLAAPTGQVILTAPDGSRHRLVVANNGALSTTPV